MIRLRLTMSRQQKSPRTALKGGAGALETPKKRAEKNGNARRKPPKNGKEKKGC